MESGTTVVLATERALDNSNAHEMSDAIGRAQSQGHKYIVVDMAKLEFLSSAGVGSIIGSVESSRETGGDIILCNLRESVMHVLSVLDLTEYLTIVQTMDEVPSITQSAHNARV
jgi:anti-anti-sigma factor